MKPELCAAELPCPSWPRERSVLERTRHHSGVPSAGLTPGSPTCRLLRTSRRRADVDYYILTFNAALSQREGPRAPLSAGLRWCRGLNLEPLESRECKSGALHAVSPDPGGGLSGGQVDRASVLRCLSARSRAAGSVSPGPRRARGLLPAAPGWLSASASSGLARESQGVPGTLPLGASLPAVKGTGFWGPGRAVTVLRMPRSSWTL